MERASRFFWIDLVAEFDVISSNFLKTLIDIRATRIGRFPFVFRIPPSVLPAQPVIPK
jgi:hypothetical protein